MQQKLKGNKQILELIDLLKNNLDYNFLKQIEILKMRLKSPAFGIIILMTKNNEGN